MPSCRRAARDLARLARACGIAAAAGPGCFLVCDSNKTHTVTETGFAAELEWFTTPAPGGPFTGSWRSGPAIELVGPAGAARSVDDGATWAAISGLPAGLGAIATGSGAERWMVGAGGLAGVWRYEGFAPGTTGTTADLHDLSTYAGFGGVAVGTEGTVLTTADGVTWAADPDVAALLGAPAPTLYAADLLSDGTLWIVGEGGLVLHRADDGWEVVDLGTDADLHDVAFASPSRGMVAGNDGAVFRTDDGGATWVAAPAPGTIHALVYVGTADEPVRWATGPDGVVWSFDGGAWHEEARTADGSALTTIADAGDLNLAAGTGPEALVLGWVEHGFTEQFERSSCPEYVGRPYVVEGAARVAPVFPADTDHADPRWLRQAQEEHASIAAFARFARQLRALGAPAALVADALAAQVDEARHAALALAMAGGGTLGALDTVDDLVPVSLLALALANAREGCIVETAAAFAAMEAAGTAATPEERRVWRTIARDETRHAALAWRFLRWAIAVDPAVHDAVAPLFVRRPASVPVSVWEQVILPAVRTMRAVSPVAERWRAELVSPRLS
ncbi:MAG: YCF48-related protein [Myxococcota bacterium]